MSNSGFSGQIPGVQTPAQARGAGRGEAVRLISAPAEIIPENRPVRIEGEVRSVSGQGRVHIATPAGDIVVQAREGVARQLEQGRRVEVEIPPENYDRQAKIREIPQEARQSETPLPQPSSDTQARRPEILPDQIRGEEPAREGVPVAPDTRISVREAEQNQKPPAPESLSVLKEGENIRLNRLPEQAQNVIRQPDTTERPLTIPVLTGGAVRAEDINNEKLLRVVAQTAKSNLFQNIAQIFRSAPPPQIDISGLLESFVTSTQSPPLPLNQPFYMQATSQDNFTGFIQTGNETQIQVRIEVKSNVIRGQAGAESSNNTLGLLNQNALALETAPSVQTALTDKNAQDPPSHPRSAKVGEIGQNRAVFNGLVSAGAQQGYISQALQPQQIGSGQMPMSTSITASVTSPATQNQTQAGSLIARVVGITPDNLPVLQFLENGFSGGSRIEGLFTPNAGIGDLPVGSTVPLQPAMGQSVSGIASAITSPLPASIPVSLQPGHWSAMTELQQTLFSGGGQAGQASQNIMPNPAQPAQMTAAMLFFVSAIRTGDMSAFFGNAAQNAVKQAGKSSLLDIVTREAISGTGKAEQPAPGGSDWRTNILPLMWEGEVHKIALWTRSEPDPENEEDKGNDGRATRFVFDLNLRQMGSVQIDGLVRADRKKLDIVVRTEKSLSAPMRKSMRGAYTKALEETPLSGELHFHARPEKKDVVASGAKNWSDLV